jgi:hypothetical protein
LGTIYIVTKEIEKNVLGLESNNNRICKLRLKGKYHNHSLIYVYGPTEDSYTDIKEQFYEVGFEVFVAVTMKNATFWDVAPCEFIINQCFRATCFQCL